MPSALKPRPRMPSDPKLSRLRWLLLDESRLRFDNVGRSRELRLEVSGPSGSQSRWVEFQSSREEFVQLRSRSGCFMDLAASSEERRWYTASSKAVGGLDGASGASMVRCSSCSPPVIARVRA